MYKKELIWHLETLQEEKEIPKLESVVTEDETNSHGAWTYHGLCFNTTNITHMS